MSLSSDRRRHNLDLSPIVAFVILGFVGAALIYSAVGGVEAESLGKLHIAQLRWLGIGIVISIITIGLNPRSIEGVAYLLFGATMLLLCAVLLLPGETAGTKRWLDVGPIAFQPSELAKIATILALARFLADRRIDPNRPGTLCWAAVLGLVPMFLILKQPDLGTSLAIPPIVLAMLYWRGLSPVRLFLIVAPALGAVIAFMYPPLLGKAAGWIHLLPWGVLMVVVTSTVILSGMGWIRGGLALASNIVAGLATPFLWGQFHDYQRQRIISFLQPEIDPRGAGYQIIQSKVAIGSGGLFGKGFREGTQSTLDFIPERHTDFIVSVLGEEWGLLGMGIVLGLFFFVIHKAIRFAQESRHDFSSLCAFGIGTVFSYHVLVNVGMATGLMAVTGLTLPLVSYGGSSLLLTMGMVGLLVGIGMRRHER